MITVPGIGRETSLLGPRFSLNGLVHEDWLPAEEGWVSALDSEVKLTAEVQSHPDFGVVRFRWRLEFSGEMTRPDPDFRITYFRVTDKGLPVEQIELSHFDPVAHSYLPGHTRLSPEQAPEGTRLPGPILRMGTFHVLHLAYEHGHDHPDSFFEFVHTQEGWELRERRVNFLPGQKGPFTSVWFQAGEGLKSLFEPRYREFLLTCVGPGAESRKARVCYNTWNYQERLKHWQRKPYLSDMNEPRILAEIEAAHRMGIEVFVIDTGWYEKTGDWEVDGGRFPGGLKNIKSALDERGMKLGLWFNPTVAALSSRVWREHPEWQMSFRGETWSDKVWETEESIQLNLVTPWAEWFVEETCRLHRELGVSCIKWDAVQQMGCDAAGQGHGGEEHTPDERSEMYGYLSGLRLQWMAEEICRRCPGMVIDFDVTERGRYFGLGFLAGGRYFLVNNGPYFHDFDIPMDLYERESNWNVFFYPGAARSRVCRTGARFDEVIPSTLFLTHYLPDGPRVSQENSLASLVLGGGGIWGDLLALSEEDLSWWGEKIGLYRRVADSAAKAFPKVQGFQGSSPEIHEKIDPETGTGLVAFFTVQPGAYSWITQPLSGEPASIVGADEVESLADGRLKLKVTLEKDGARTVFLLPKGEEA